MKKRYKISLIIALISLFSGLSLGYWGYQAGGLEDIKTLTQPKQKKQTFSALEKIDINLLSHNLIIQPSDDDQWHLSYYVHQRLVTNPLDIKEENKTLFLKNKEINDIQMTGVFYGTGYWLNNQDKNTNNIILSVPKGHHIKEITGSTASVLNLNQVSVDHLQLSGDIVADEAMIHSGDISVSREQDLFISNSQLKNVTIDQIDYLRIKNSQIINSQLSTLEGGQIDLITSEIKETQIRSMGGFVTVDDSLFDTVQYQGDVSSFRAKNLKLHQTVTLTDQAGNIDLSLHADNQDKTNLIVHSWVGDLEVSDRLLQDANLSNQEIGDRQIYRNEKENAKATLTIKGEGSHININ